MRITGAARAGEGEGYHRLASGNLSCRYRQDIQKRDHLWLEPDIRVVNKDDLPGGEHHIVRDIADANPVRCQDDGFSAVQVLVAHASTDSSHFCAVRNDMLFRLMLAPALVVCMRECPAVLSQHNNLCIV